MNMRLRIARHGYAPETNREWLHFRVGALGNALVAVMQQQDVRHSDAYFPIYGLYSEDGGETWSEPVPQEGLLHPDWTLSDGVPFFHRQTGELLLTGGGIAYEKQGESPILDDNYISMYSTYDAAAHAWRPLKTFLDERGEPLNMRATPGRRIVLDDGDILLPVSRPNLDGTARRYAQVLRFGFDGERMTLKEAGNQLRADCEARGFAEPSLARYRGRYYLTLRTDSRGYRAVSADGLNFSEPEEWLWDTGEPLPNKNTQNSWVVGGDALYLVYTRVNGKNDHVNRNRAPLYMARVDAEKMRVMRHTEIELVPERCCDLGNFGVIEIDEHKTLVTTTEDMDAVKPGCAPMGDNASYMVELCFS